MMEALKALKSRLQMIAPVEELKHANTFIEIDPDDHSIKITLQNNPRKEVGVNGTQVDMLGAMWRELIAYLNRQFPCEENRMAIHNIDLALDWQRKRTIDRTERGVEGYNSA